MDEFTELAQRKSIVDYMLRIISDRLIDGDTGAREKVICEDVAYRDREVSQRVIQEYSERLQQESHELQLEMNKFTLMRKTDVKQSKPTPAPQPVQKSVPQSKHTKRGRASGKAVISGSSDETSG